VRYRWLAFAMESVAAVCRGLATFTGRDDALENVVDCPVIKNNKDACHEKTKLHRARPLASPAKFAREKVVGWQSKRRRQAMLPKMVERLKRDPLNRYQREQAVHAK